VPGAQAQILMGGLAPSLTDPDLAAMKVVSTVLGGGLASRFFSELRDKQGLAYTTAAREPMRVGQGYFLALLGTAPANKQKAEAALREQLERIQRQAVSDEELRVAKAYVLGSLAMDRRTNARQAWYMASLEVAGVGHEFLDRYVAQVRAVTKADVQRAAQRYLATVRRAILIPSPRSSSTIPSSESTPSAGSPLIKARIRWRTASAECAALPPEAGIAAVKKYLSR